MEDVRGRLRGRLRRASTASSAASAASRRRQRRAPSAASAASTGRESAGGASTRGSVRSSEFGAFLSDSSSSDEEEEDADARAIARMQQQADDRAYLPDRVDALMFRLDSPNGDGPAAGFLPEQVAEEDEDAGESFIGRSFARQGQEQDASFAGSDLRPSVEDDELGDSQVGAAGDRTRASEEEQSSDSDADGDGDGDGDGDYIEEDDDSFVAVHRPAYDDDEDEEGDGSDEDEAGRRRHGVRDTSVFEVAATTAAIGGEEDQAASGDDAECASVAIDEAPPPPTVDDMQQQERHYKQGERADDAGYRGSSFSGTASPAPDLLLSSSDSFVGDRRSSADRSFMNDKPRPTFGSAGKGSFGSSPLSAGDSFLEARRVSTESADDSFLEAQRPTFGSAGAASFSDPFLSVNDSFVGARRDSTDSAGKSFLEDKPRPTHGSAGAGSFSEDIDASFRLDGYGDSFGSMHNDSYTADHAPYSDSQPNVSDLSVDPEQIRFSRVPSSIPRDSSRPIDFRDTQHKFDEEEVHLHHTSPQSSLHHLGESAEDDVPGFRESSFGNSLNSSASSFVGKDGNFFVGSDRGSAAESYSRSISDSFASVVIMGDTALDVNSFVGVARQSDASVVDENSDKLDRSYSDLIDRQTVKPPLHPQAVPKPSEPTSDQQVRTSMSSGAGSVVSLSSASASSVATDDELSFVSFNGGGPPAAAPSSELSSSKSTASGSCNRSQASSLSFYLRDSDATVRHADSFIGGQRVADSVSGVGDPSKAQAGSFVDASFTSSIDDSMVYPDARTRGDTRSDEVEAGDVVQEVLPSVPPPLKLGIAATSPATTAPLGMSSSFGSLGGSDIARNTDDKLDFTGVYRGSVNSLDSSRVASGQAAPRAPPPPPSAESVVEQPEATAPPPATLSASVVRLGRSVSDNVQRESQRKVEDFFRRTYQYQNGDDGIEDIDGDIRWTTRNRATRSRTTVIYCVDENEEERDQISRNRSSTIATTKIIDLKHLKGGPKAYQKVLTPQRESDDSDAYGATDAYVAKETPSDVPARRKSRLSTNDLMGDSIDPVSMEMPSDTSYYANLGKDVNGTNPLEVTARPLVATAAHYGLSPKARDAQAHRSGFLAASGATVKRVGGFGAFGGNRRADNASLTSLTPSQPRISMDSSSHAPSPYTVAMLAKSPGMSKWQQEHPSSRDLGLSPGSSVSIKESLFRPTGLSRPTFSEQVASRVHQLSLSLTSTIRRAGAALFGQSAVKQQGEGDPTSPQSACPAPPRLARGFDEREFYTRFARCGGVEDPRGPPVKPAGPLSHRQRKKRNVRLLRIAAGSIVGIVLGIILAQIGGLDDVFGLDAAQAHEKQAFNGELVLATATQWLLLPGRLFLRVWNCVAIPLLFCHVANGVADVAMGGKASLLLGFRFFGIMLLISAIATLEGVAAMAITNRAGWFQASDAVKISTMAAAQRLEQALGTSVYADGAVGLLCSSNHEYLQQVASGRFNCSNASITLPLYDGASGNGTIQGSGAAVFALHELTSTLSTMGANASAAAARYYPEGLSTSAALGALLETSVPSNSAQSFVQSSPLGVAAVAVVVGLFCGKRAFHRLLAAKAAMDSSTRSYNTRTAMAADQNARQPHYLVGVLVELQLALEWILEQLEAYVAPVGVLSLLAGNMAAHYHEWHTIVTPMTQLISGVFVLCLVHVVVVVPAVMTLCFKTNVFTKLLVPFIPSFLFAFSSGSAALTAPVTVRCFSDARIVTKSAAQVMASVTAVLHRSGHALYFPLALLWLMETNTLSANASALDFDGSSYLFISLLTLCSCFAAPSPASTVASGLTSRGNLVVMATLWRAVLSHSASSAAAATAVPATFPLLVLCDLLLSRVVDVVNVYGTLMVTLLVADHCDEVVVHARDVSNSVLSPVYL